MVDKLQSMPEYQELLEILQEKLVYGERIIKLLWELSLRGNVFSNWKVMGIPCVFFSHMHKISWC
jgi:hypothetical protein